MRAMLTHILLATALALGLLQITTAVEAADYFAELGSIEGRLFEAVEVAANSFRERIPDAVMADYYISIDQINDQYLISFHRLEENATTYDVYLNSADLSIIYSGYID